MAENGIGSVVFGHESAANMSEWKLAEVVLFKDYNEGLLRFATACCFIFMIIGIPGNIITIIALSRYEKVRNATAIFIINLSCSDLLFCCFNLPLAASTFIHQSWVHGRLLCRLFPLMRYALVAAALLTVTAITINRYVIIAHPRLYPKMYKTWNIGLMLLAIWMTSFSALIATWLDKYGSFGLDVNIGSCSIIPDKNGRTPKKMLFITMFTLPCLAIILCYTRIFFIVRKTSKNSKTMNKCKELPSSDELSSVVSSDSMSVKVSGPEVSTSDNTESQFTEPVRNTQKAMTFQIETRDEIKRKDSGLRRTALRKSMAMLKFSLPTRKDRRLGTMIIAIMISFCICHLPITITKMLREMNPNPGCNIASYLLLYLSSCINPVIYVVMSNEYRKAYKNLFRCKRKS